MDRIRKNLGYLLMNCDFDDGYGGWIDNDPYFDAVEVVDNILSLIYGIDAENPMACKFVIDKVKNLIMDYNGEYIDEEDYDEDLF